MIYSSDEPLYDKREFYPFNFPVGFSHYPEQGWIITQFTGLKDKNGKEIYEGDIYLAHRSYMPGRWHKRKGYPDRITVICVVEWSIYNAGWEPKEISPIKEHIEFEKNCPYYYYNTSLMGAQDGNADWIEVIGNIYENPELITQTN